MGRWRSREHPVGPAAGTTTTTHPPPAHGEPIPVAAVPAAAGDDSPVLTVWRQAQGKAGGDRLVTTRGGFGDGEPHPAQPTSKQSRTGEVAGNEPRVTIPRHPPAQGRVVPVASTQDLGPPHSHSGHPPPWLRTPNSCRLWPSTDKLDAADQLQPQVRLRDRSPGNALRPSPASSTLNPKGPSPIPGPPAPPPSTFLASTELVGSDSWESRLQKT